MPANPIITISIQNLLNLVKRTVCEAVGNADGVVCQLFESQSLRMDISCPNIWHVVHWEVPRTMEAYMYYVLSGGWLCG